jgi:hypothetical protein
LIVPANLILAASMNVGQHEQQRGQWKPGFARWSALLFAWFAIALGVHLNSPAWYEHLSTFQTIGLYTIWSLPVPFVAVRAYREQQDGGIFR